MRREVYKKAKAQKPNRWSKEIRNWDHISEVSLNPLKGKRDSSTKMTA